MTMSGCEFEIQEKWSSPMEYIIYRSRIIVDYAAVFYVQERVVLPFPKQMFVLPFYMSTDFEVVQNIIKF